MRTPILSVLVKELREHFRDRRSLMTAAVMAVFGPMLMYVMFGQIGKLHSLDQPLTIRVVHGERAPNLLRFLEDHGATIEPAPSDYEAQVRKGSLDFALVVPEDYARSYEASEPATVELVRDSSRQKMGDAQGRAENLLRQYGNRLLLTRLVARGVSPLLMRPLNVEGIDLATAASRAARAMSMMAMFILTTAFIGGVNAALDTTAGERERGSLEPLLLNPVSRRAIVLGKASAALVATWAVVALNLAGTAWALGHLPIGAGLRLHLGPAQLAWLAAILVPISVFGVGLQMLLGIFSRSFREGQTSASMLGFIPMAPGLYLFFNPGELAAWAKMVPFLGQTILIDEVLRGNALSLLPFTLSAAGSLALGLGCMAGVASLLKRERVIFGR